VQVFTDGLAPVDHSEPVACHPVAQVEVLVEEREALLVEAADSFEHRALDRHVRGVEVRPARLVSRQRPVVELDALLEPAHERGDPQPAGPHDRTEHAHALVWLPFVAGQMLAQRAGSEQDVVADERHQRGPSGSPADVARGRHARSGAAELADGERPRRTPQDPCHGGRIVLVGIVDHDHLEEVGREALALERGERAGQRVPTTIGGDHHG